MAGLTPIADLPTRLTMDDAMLAAHRDDIEWIADKLSQKMNVLVTCEKQMVLPLYGLLRAQLRRSSSSLILRLIGGPSDGEEGPGSIIQNTINQLSESIFSGETDLCLIVPHLDVAITTTQSGLSDRAREVVAMIYENPEVSILAFRDPSFEIPKAVERVFSAQRSIGGIPRDCLPNLMTQTEARKFGVETLNPYAIYKYVSGLNVLRFREIMEFLVSRMDYNPLDEHQTNLLYREIREMTVPGGVSIPEVDLDKDIGGYEPVKKKIRQEILELLSYKASLTDPREIKEIEEIIPKGMLFVGPPGTGKTYFAKAIACALNATVHIVSGPELKSKWVGESEGNLREVFAKARKSAPSIIVFDEIDSFATTRGTYSGSGVEHSMVNQLLTEMDGFRKEELVFVIGTTNFPESLDPALLRPGRFEMQIEIPYPDDKDREIILKIYREKFTLNISDELLELLVQKTSGFADIKSNTRFSGDHLYAIARSLKRESVRRSWETKGAIEVTEEDCLNALTQKTGKNAKLGDGEERVIAIHEAGHAILAHYCPNATGIERITVATDSDSIAGYVLRSESKNKYVRTKSDFLDDICICMGGRVAEAMFSKDVSSGCSNDLQQATMIARAMVENLGMSDTAGLQAYSEEGGRQMSASLKEKLETEISAILAKEHVRAQALIKKHKKMHEKLVEALLEKKTLYKKEIQELLD